MRENGALGGDKTASVVSQIWNMETLMAIVEIVIDLLGVPRLREKNASLALRSRRFKRVFLTKAVSKINIVRSMRDNAERIGICDLV